MIYTAIKETGTFIESVQSIEEGQALIEQYERQDQRDGLYEEGFYDIVNENHETLI
jgi:hypothetical protein